MNTPNPFIEEAVKAFDERFPFDNKDGSMFYTRRLVKEWFSSKLTLALEKGKLQGMIENTDKVSEFSFAAGFKEGEVAGRKATVEYIKSMMEDEEIKRLHLGLVLEQALQASNE